MRRLSSLIVALFAILAGACSSTSTGGSELTVTVFGPPGAPSPHLDALNVTIHVDDGTMDTRSYPLNGQSLPGTLVAELPARVTGGVAVIVVALDSSQRSVAQGESSVRVEPGQTQPVTVHLVASALDGGVDGGSDGGSDGAADVAATPDVAGSADLAPTDVAVDGTADGASDAQRGDASLADATADLRAPDGGCRGPFANIVPMTLLNTLGDDQTPFLSADGLSLYFSSSGFGGAGSNDLFVAKRAHPGDAFTTVDSVELALVNTANFEASPSVTANGLTLYFQKNEPAAVTIWRARRQSQDQPFDAPTAVAELNAAGSLTGGPYISPDGTTIYFDSTRDGPWKIYRASMGTSEFDPPEEVIELSIGPDVFHPLLTNDQLTIYCQLAVPDISTGDDQTDIYVGTRPTIDDPFSNIQAVSELNFNTASTPGLPIGNTFDDTATLSTDGCEAYFSSTRAGTWDIYRATR